MKTRRLILALLASAIPLAACADTVAGSALGRTLLEDGRTLYKLSDSNYFYLAAPVVPDGGEAAAVELSAAFQREIVGLGPGMHQLSDGRTVLMMESRDVVLLPKGPLPARPRSATAVETSPGVWVESHYKEIIDNLRASTTAEVLDGLGTYATGMNRREAFDSSSRGITAFPLFPGEGSWLAKNAIDDLRFDRLLKDFRAMGQEATAQILGPKLREENERHVRWYGKFREHATVHTRQGESIGTFASDVLPAQVKSEPENGASEAPSVSLNSLLLLAGATNCAPLHEDIKAVVYRVIATRDEIYASNPSPEIRYSSLLRAGYHRPILLTALVGTAAAPAEGLARAVALGAYIESRMPDTYDAYASTPAALKAAPSGQSPAVEIINVPSDEVFDAILAEYTK